MTFLTFDEAPPPAPEIIQDDQGRYRFSLADEAPSFETVTFASAVAAARHRDLRTNKRDAREEARPGRGRVMAGAR